MNRYKKFPLFILSLCVSATLHAQIEVAQLMTKGESATGFGTYLHAGFPLGKADEISGEAGLYYFAPGSSHLAFIPLLAGYRYTLDRSGTRFYVEPFAGYSLGGSDIEKMDANGNTLYNSDGSVQDQKISGATAGLGFGYLVPSASVPLNIGLRFEHIFVSGDPAQSLLSLRISWSLLTGRRLQQ